MLLLGNLGNWLYPHKCIFCQSIGVNPGGFICSKCINEITFFNGPVCSICGNPLETEYPEVCADCEFNPKYFSSARSLFDYQPRTKPLIYNLKNKNDKALFAICAKLLYKNYEEIINSADIIVPVPTHWSRRLRRGYNPPDTLAYLLSKISSLKLSRSLKKVKISAYQKEKTKEERAINVKDSFKVVGTKLKNKAVILVDDVYTTGATVNECSKTILSAGASRVIVLTIARVIKKINH